MTESENIKLKIEYITPKIEDLSSNKNLPCPELNCLSVFTNPSRLQMHLTKHHYKKVIQNSQPNIIKRYYCPGMNCIYNETKYFNCLKYLRQHYQKVHAYKNYKCTKCDKLFAMEGARDTHQTNCGRIYICDICEWSYISREALLTHAKRKGHKINIEKTRNIKKSITPNDNDRNNQSESQQNEISIKLNETKEQSSQTESDENIVRIPKKKPNRSKPIKHVQIQTIKRKPTELEITNCNKKSNINFDLYDDCDIGENEKDNLNRLNYVEDTINSCFDQLVNSSSLCDIETQTEFSTAILDQMIYTNIHTQTCDEFLSELGLADIQTQTNWSTITNCVNDNNGTGISGAHDELLVSTETQTSFTQCLLECNKSSVNNGGITQHTQTCDTLLEGLFGGQENDLISNFQSTHTQT